MSAAVRTLARARSEADKVPVILDAAAACFTERGYYATTIDEIAARCGSTKGLIYYHFKSKTDLFFAVYHLAMSRPIERARTIFQQEGSGAERLARMGRAHLLGMMEHLTYHHVSRQGVELHLMSALTPEQQRSLRGLIRLRDEYEALYASALQAGLADGTLRCGQPSLAAKIFLGALNGTSVWYRKRAGETAAMRERLAAEILSSVMNGFLRQEGSGPPAEEGAG